MSKKHFGKAAAVLMALAMGVTVTGVFAACDDGTPTVEETPTSYLEDLDDYRAYIKADLESVLESIGTVDGGSIDTAVKAAYNDGVAAIEAAASVSAVEEAYDAAKTAMAECIPLADGTYSYTSLSAGDKTEILGILEAYAVRNGLTGITMFENGSYVMYSDRVTLGTENYISGYGFGTLAEGSITAPMDAETNSDWKMYYHTYSVDDPGTANFLDAQGSDVDEFYSYIGGSYYTTYMNEEKNGYDWVPELAAADPEPLNLDSETNQATKWRVELRQGLKYSTLGKYASEYNDREIALEDYITPFKLLLNQTNDLYRGNELSNATGAASFVGAKSYYDKTAGKRQGVLSDSEADFSGVGIKAYEENGKWYLEFELGGAVTTYYARYYLSSTLYTPVPADFIEKVGVDAYLGFSTDGTTSPVDNSLSVGAYILEKWDSDQQIVYKKNPNYVYASTKYSVEGIHYNILAAAGTDKEAAIKEFLAGKLDGAGIPDTYLAEYQNDPRTRKTLGSSCFKLNMNALDQESWEYFFGENGVVSQTSKENYWECEPAMSNEHFRTALSYALNRNAFAASKGYISSVNFFSSNYMSDPENGVAYNATDAHKNAVASLTDGTDDGGYSLELAREYFRMALDELEAEGKYTPGTVDNPTVISIDVIWMYASHEEGYHKYVKQYWEDAFNDESVSGGLYKLEVTFSVGDTYMYAYNQMLAGQFDIGFGSISGNTLNPLGFMSVLSSDPTISGSFTLNWAFDTNDPTADILVYDGMRWSYDALYKAANEVAIVEDGKNQATVSMGDQSLDLGTDKATVKVSISHAAGVELSVDDLVLFGYDQDGNYGEGSVMDYVTDSTYDEATRTYTYTLELPAELYNYFLAGENQGIDAYWSYSIPAAGVTMDSAFGGTFYFEFVS